METKISTKHKIIWDEMFRYIYKGMEFVVVMDHQYLKEDGKYYPPEDDCFMTQIPAEFWDSDEKFDQLAHYCLTHPEYAEQFDIPLGVIRKGRYCNDQDYQYIINKLNTN
jgi:hypothetical protein